MLCALLLSGCGAHTGEIPLVNAGFETQGASHDAVPGWRLAQHAGAPAYEMSVDTQAAAEGRASFRMRRLTPQFYGAISQEVKLPPGSGGRKATLTARMKTQGVGSKGWILVLTVIATSGNTQFRSQPMSGDHDFGSVEVSTRLVDDAQAIEVSALLRDDGTGWLDDVHLRIDAN